MTELDGNPPVVTLSDDVVLLRPWGPSEASFIAEASKDPAIDRYNSPPHSLADARAVIDRFERNWRTFATSGEPSGVAFAIVDAASGELAGMCGVDEWSSTDVAKIGYWLVASARRQGFATRAVKLMTGWLFKLGAARVFLTVVSDNAASAAVAQRAGFAYEGTLRAHGVWQGRRHDVDVFAVLPDEWVAHLADATSGPLFRKVDCLSLRVASLDAALAFYSEGLGHELIWRSDSAAGLKLPDSNAELVLHTDDRPTETDLTVESVVDAVARFTAAGGKVLAGPFEIAIGQCAVVADPWDNVLVLLDTSKGLLRVDEHKRVVDNDPT